jgi:hypothetical protein
MNLRKKLPVSAKLTATGWLSNGIAFDDFAKMQTTTRKTAGERRLPTPAWAMSNVLLRLVLVRFMEERAFSKKERLSVRKKAGLKERLDNAKKRIMAKRPAAMLVLDRLCEEYVEIKNKGLKPGITDKEWNESKPQPFMEFAEGEARYQDEKKRLKQLESEIEGIDTYLRISENGGADIVAAVVYLYYRTGYDSVGVAEELGIKPPHVRQTIYRLHQTAKRLEAEGKFSGVSTKKKVKSVPRLVTPSLF